MLIEVSTARAFIEALSADERKLVTRDLDHLLALEELLRAATDERWSVDALSAAIASLYALDREQWDKLHRLTSQFLAGEATAFTPEQRSRLHVRLATTVPRRRKGVAIAVSLTLLSTAVLGAAWWRFEGGPTDRPAVTNRLVDRGRAGIDRIVDRVSKPDPILEPQPKSETPVVDGPRVISDGSVLREVEIGPPATSRVPEPIWPLAVLLVLSTLVATFGAAAVAAVRRAPKHFRAHVLERQAQAIKLRRESDNTYAPVPYHVERHPPFPTEQHATLDDAATILARIGEFTSSRALDVEPSLARTVALGGRPAPVMRERIVPHELVVLVDIEAGDHPFLAGVEWLLDRWQHGGVLVQRFDFQRMPTINLREHRRKYPSGITALARATHGIPMLLFSRGVRLTDETQWLDDAKRAWPLRVFVDLDPRVLDELDPVSRGVRTRMIKSGFERVPFTPVGLVHAALHLAGREPAGSVPEPKLAPLSAVEPAIESWLAVAACVPDPTWAQLEVFRQRFPELTRALPDPRYVQRALEYAGYDPIKDHGKRLDLLPEHVAKLQAKQIAKDDAAGRPLEQQLIHRAHRLLLEQLELAKPNESSPAYPMWSLKYAKHQAMLAPARADELLAPFLVHRLRAEMLAMVADYEQLCRTLGKPPVELPRVHAEAWVDEQDEIEDAGEEHGLATRGVVPTASVRLSFPGALVGLVFGVLGAAAAWGVAIAKSTNREPTLAQVPADLQLLLPPSKDGSPVEPPKPPTGSACDFASPPTPAAAPSGNLQADSTGAACGVVATALADTASPMQLIGLTEGAFTMGSPASEPGHDDDEGPQHRVAVSRFAMCETEVSVAQYRLVTGASPSDCDYGCEDDDPVHDVSWEDAARFMNSLTRHENGKRSGAPLTECYDEGTWAWDRTCTGYRLPTEAEWEYAARAGSRTAYSFGDDEGELCKYGYVRWCEGGKKVVSVKGRRANDWGLYGVHGNVWEWVFDVYDEGFYGRSPSVDPDNDKPNDKQNDTERAGSDVYRALRGGSVFVAAGNARSANRVGNSPGVWVRYFGFRCVVGPRPQP